MSNKPSRLFKLSGLMVSALERFTSSSVSVEGLENLRANPTLFVVNHFTRMETVLLPHALYKFNGQMVHSLADCSLFVGKLGNFLTSLGAFPTDLENRDVKIISELMRGSSNWVIYPEGSMVKNKESNKIGRPHTGAAILALKSFLFKEDYKRAIADNNEELITHYQNSYDLQGPGDISPLDLCIVPVNITYYPLRPGKNIIATAVQLLTKELSAQMEEELLVEGKLLLEKSDISISFGHPIELRSFTKPYRALFKYALPFLPRQQRINALLTICRHRLTRLFMRRVYTRLLINMDHLVATALRHMPAGGMPESRFKELLYLAIVTIQTLNDRRVHSSLQEGIVSLIAGEQYQPYDESMRLAIDEGVVARRDGYLHIDESLIRGPSLFHRVRLENTTRVFANEFAVMRRSVAIVKKLAKTPASILAAQVAVTALEKDRHFFEQERIRSYVKEVTKDREVGRPRYLAGDADKPGIVLAHGFLAAPVEMLELAQYLNKRGYGVYLVRLAGHGTHASELEKIELKSWRESFDRAYAVIRRYHSRVVLGGFSAGALLALIKAASAEVDGVFGINPALVLRQKTAYFSPLVDSVNRLMQAGRMDAATFSWVSNESENPAINYDRIYMGGLSQFVALQKLCREKLSTVRAPLLIVQGSDDPVLDSRGAEEIIAAVGSEEKALERIVFKRHIIVSGPDSREVFKMVESFVERVVV